MFTFKNTKNQFSISKKVSSLEKSYVKPIIDKLNKTLNETPHTEVMNAIEAPCTTVAIPCFNISVLFVLQTS